MTDSPANQRGARQAEAELLGEELRREHKLVRNTGAISKPVMAIAFGVAFLIVAVLLALSWRQWPCAFVLGAIGTMSASWAVYTWAQNQHRDSSK